MLKLLHWLLANFWTYFKLLEITFEESNDVRFQGIPKNHLTKNV